MLDELRELFLALPRLAQISLLIGLLAPLLILNAYLNPPPPPPPPPPRRNYTMHGDVSVQEKPPGPPRR